MGNKIACDAAMSQIKTPGASSSPVGVRCSVSRNMVAGIANSVSDKTKGASSSPVGARCGIGYNIIACAAAMS